MVVHQINSVEEFKKAIKDNKSVFLDASAVWCGPCKAISPILSKLSDEDNFKETVYVAKFDVDDVPDLTQELGVTAMPTFFSFKNGELIAQLRGANPAGVQSALEVLSQ
jgi:thioredoxin 1